jgi:hypothetical protein
MPVILATQEAKTRRIMAQSQLTVQEKLFTKIGLVEWLKVKALSSSPITQKKKKKQQKINRVSKELSDEVSNVEPRRTAKEPRRS